MKDVEELEDMIIDGDEPDYDDQIDELPTTSKRRKLFNDISKNGFAITNKDP